MANDPLTQLRLQLQQLEQEVLQHDRLLSATACRLIQDSERFNNELFVQHGAALAPCIQQIRTAIEQLDKQLKMKLSAQLIALSCQRIQDKFVAVKKALTSTKINLKAAQQTQRTRKTLWAKRQQNQHQQTGFEWIASSIMQNSHQLYQELNKHLNWAEKFTQKIAELDMRLANCHSNDKIKLQNEILSMHKRLGKCRQAITYIEDRIQALERPNFRNR
ncbi:primosomal replication protein [Shewanella sp. NIFS-20-20]|uniref:primosomal replication protein n=1 Tax=Shewanella sp. NIFS-20-20 TaxID=2853806 RepID=UPI001C490A43|nr:primosomal replication protein [Shewanella sp. NIFS-20-20]MBV7315951.1 primosomal replication protein [Shewanella sp. NIFS-20-20]